MESLRVFLSSTAEDLPQHRERVALAIEQMGNTSIRMETFGAQPGAPLETCSREVAKADVAVVIVAWRYGWVPPAELGGDGSKSITRLEVEAALARGIPVFAFVVDDNFAWPGKKDEEPAAATGDAQSASARQAVQGLREFKAMLGQAVTTKRFTTPDDLAVQVTTSLARWLQSRAGERKRKPIVSVDVMPPESPNPSSVIYAVERNSGESHIVPRHPYLDLLDAGGPIEPIDYDWTPFRAEPPRLDIKIVNNTPETVFFSEAILRTELSSVDPRPLLLLHGHGFKMMLPLENLGFGEASACTIRFALAPEGDREDWTAPLPFQTDATSALAEGRYVDLGAQFSALAVDVECLRRADSLAAHVVDADPDASPGPEQLIEACGPFTTGRARIWGSIEYAGGDGISRTVTFRSLVALHEPLPRAPVPPGMVYDAAFEVDKAGYDIRVPVSQAVKAGEVDRFSVRMAAPKASSHRFKVVLRYNDTEEVESPAINLRLFMTRTDTRLMRKEGSPDEGILHPSGRRIPRRAER